MDHEARLRAEIIRVGRMMRDRNLVFATGGNVSAKVDDESFLITPSGVRKGEMREEDLVLVRLDGTWSGMIKPSIETPLHTAIYRSQEVGAVVHAHPPCCTALAVAGIDLLTGLIPEGVMVLGEVPTIPYRTPGTQELADALTEVKGARAFLMERHGALTVGRDLEEAYNRMEEMEFIACLQLKVMSLGEPQELPLEERRKLGGS